MQKMTNEVLEHSTSHSPSFCLSQLLLLFMSELRSNMGGDPRAPRTIQTAWLASPCGTCSAAVIPSSLSLSLRRQRPPQSPLHSHCLAPGLTSIALHKYMLAKWRNCKNLPVKLEGACRVMTGASAKWGKWAEEKERSNIYVWKMQRTFPLPTLSCTLWGISVPSSQLFLAPKQLLSFNISPTPICSNHPCQGFGVRLVLWCVHVQFISFRFFGQNLDSRHTSRKEERFLL